MGSPGYIWKETGIGYDPDEGFTETGENNNITTNVDETIEPYLKNLRSFPEGKRNCYTLKPKAGRNNTYLVRATFFYGNYDSQYSPPAFDLHLGTDLWTSVTFSTDFMRVVRHEIIYIPTTNYIDVCLVNTNKGVPFISALELRLLNNDIYKTQSGSALQIWERNDYGGNTTQPPNRNLTQRELAGEVAHSISNLKSLESLNLAGNNFIGSVPQALLSKNGSTLTLSVDENPYLCVSPCGTKKSSKNMYIVPVSIVSLLVLVVSVGAFIFWKCRRKGSQATTTHKTELHAQEMAIEITKEVVLSAVESTKIPLLSNTQSFTYSEISSMTNNFDTPLGKGASGEVYRGYLKDQGEVAVKILTESSTESARLFQTEVELLWRIHHNRLVSFLGYCDDGTNMAVVYEFMASGSLKKNLSEENPKILTLQERLQIAVDAAQGLEYLHKHCTPSIVHRDLKPDNILLDKNLRAKISDFGISIIFEAGSRTHISAEKIAGTIGYLDPESTEICQTIV